MKGRKGLSPVQLKRQRMRMLRRQIGMSRMIGGKNSLATAKGVNSKNLKAVIQQAESQRKKSWVERTGKGAKVKSTSIPTKAQKAAKRKNPVNAKRLNRISSYLTKRANRPVNKIPKKTAKGNPTKAQRPIQRGYKTRQNFAKMQQARKSKVQAKPRVSPKVNAPKLTQNAPSRLKGLQMLKSQIKKQPHRPAPKRQPKIIRKGR